MTSPMTGDKPTFKISAPLLEGSSLAFAYEVGTETAIVRERLMPTPVSRFIYFSDKSEAMAEAANIQLGILRKKYDEVDTRYKRKERAAARENLDALITEVDAGVASGDYRTVEFIPSPAREIDGSYLPVGAPIYVIDNERDDPKIDTYKVSQYLYFGGRVLYYQCMPVSTEDDEAADFRITSDYLREDGQVFLPASRGEKVSMFWTKFAASERLHELLHSDENLNEGDTEMTNAEQLDELLSQLMNPLGEDLDQESDGPSMSMG